MRTKILLSAALLGLPLMGSGEVQARSLGKILYDSGLAPDDISVMETAAQQLFEPMGSTGAARRWSNPETHSKGAVNKTRDTNRRVYAQTPASPKIARPTEPLFSVLKWWHTLPWIESCQ